MDNFKFFNELAQVAYRFKHFYRLGVLGFHIEFDGTPSVHISPEEFHLYAEGQDVIERKLDENFYQLQFSRFGVLFYSCVNETELGKYKQKSTQWLIDAYEKMDDHQKEALNELIDEILMDENEGDK